MAKNKGKGGKNRRRGKNDTADKRELIFKEDGQGKRTAFLKLLKSFTNFCPRQGGPLPFAAASYPFQYRLSLPLSCVRTTAHSVAKTCKNSTGEIAHQNQYFKKKVCNPLLPLSQSVVPSHRVRPGAPYAGKRPCRGHVHRREEATLPHPRQNEEKGLGQRRRYRPLGAA